MRLSFQVSVKFSLDSSLNQEYGHLNLNYIFEMEKSTTVATKWGKKVPFFCEMVKVMNMLGMVIINVCN